jgi:hypothetical protein
MLVDGMSIFAAGKESKSRMNPMRVMRPTGDFL